MRAICAAHNLITTRASLCQRHAILIALGKGAAHICFTILEMWQFVTRLPSEDFDEEVRRLDVTSPTALLNAATSNTVQKY
jgi:hypothetical protein